MNLKQAIFIAVIGFSTLSPAYSNAISWPTTKTWLKAGLPITLVGGTILGVSIYDIAAKYCKHKGYKKLLDDKATKKMNGYFSYIVDTYPKIYPKRAMLAVLSAATFISGLALLAIAGTTYTVTGK